MTQIDTPTAAVADTEVGPATGTPVSSRGERRDRPALASIPQIANAIAVASGKGGVGKTWMSITLAHAMALRGKRVLLFDGDLGLANVDIQLGLMPKRDLAAVLEGVISLKAAVQRFEAGGFDIIAGRSGSTGLSSLSSMRLAELQEQLAVLAKSYDCVIVDLGAGINGTVRQMAGQAGKVIVVTTEEPTAVTDAYAFIKVMHKQRAADIRVIVNMAATSRDGEATYATLLKAAQTFLKRTPPLAGIVRLDRRVRDSIRAQIPLLTRAPKSEAGQDVETIARQLV